MGYYQDKMEELDADGIDFIPIFYDVNLAPIIESYTREEFKNVDAVPKTSYRYWKIENGQKKYLI